ncbi:hypothetical protein AAFF_G00150540 [Aldrovandia affinis]|uniref:Uncharacterized protein n=1 Tax=Aldrovandia affinis TaxID=143900 RepID=A0AAD7RPF7_9TELE|nr:hypothetical protein AAFF_G00150540 [Aldrovandia affinis]
MLELQQELRFAFLSENSRSAGLSVAVWRWPSVTHRRGGSIDSPAGGLTRSACGGTIRGERGSCGETLAPHRLFGSSAEERRALRSAIRGVSGDQWGPAASIHPALAALRPAISPPAAGVLSGPGPLSLHLITMLREIREDVALTHPDPLPLIVKAGSNYKTEGWGVEAGRFTASENIEMRRYTAVCHRLIPFATNCHTCHKKGVNNALV